MLRVDGFTLRKPELRDVEALHVIKNDREIAAMLGGFGNGYSRADLEAWVQHHGTARDEAFFVIADGDDRAVGHVALYKIDHRIGSAEFAILIGERKLWGTGLGRACSRQIIQYGFDELNLQRIYLEVLESNPRAQRLYESMGFVVEGKLRRHQFKNGRHVDVVVMGLLREDFVR
jgi:RimJ/RimL family protein N-acetyltransferase